MLTGFLHGLIKVRVDEVFVIYFDSTRLYTGKYCLETPVLITHFQYVLKYAQNFKGTVLSLFWLKSPITVRGIQVGITV